MRAAENAPPELAFDRCGSGEPLVLLHGLGAGRRIWARLTPYLTSHHDVVIAWGTKDRLLRPRQALRFAERIPGAGLVALERLGHVAMSDDPEQMALVILQTTGEVEHA